MEMSKMSIDFEAIEADVDEDGCIDPVDADEDGLGVETRYARLYTVRGTEEFVEFVADYQDCYIATRVPWEVMREIIKDYQPPSGGATP